MKLCFLLSMRVEDVTVSVGSDRAPDARVRHQLVRTGGHVMTEGKE